MKSKIFILLFTILAISVNAQTEDRTSFFSYGFQGLNADFSDFNNQIGDAYPMLKNQVLGLTTETGYKLNKWTGSIGFSYYLGFEEEGESLKRTTFRGYGASVNLGYDLLSKKLFVLQPFIEMGIRRYNLALSENVRYNFREIINEEIKNPKFKSWGFYTDLGLSATKYFDLPKMRMGLSLSAGYRFDQGDWKFNNVNTLSNEISKMDGVFCKFKVIFILNKKEISEA